MTDDFSCDTCLRYGTVISTERDGPVLRLRHDPCPACHATGQEPADDEQHRTWTRGSWPRRGPGCASTACAPTA